MGIQPIDLQTMYSQMNNLAQNVAAGQNSVAAGQSAVQVQSAKQSLEKNSQVQKAADNEAQTMDIKKDGGNSSSGAWGSGKKKNGQEEEEEQKPAKNPYLEPYLGKHIDIVR